MILRCPADPPKRGSRRFLPTTHKVWKTKRGGIAPAALQLLHSLVRAPRAPVPGLEKA